MQSFLVYILLSPYLKNMQDKATGALGEQLKDLQMQEFIPYIDGVAPVELSAADGIDSEDEKEAQALAAAAAEAVGGSRGTARSFFRAQKHQVGQGLKEATRHCWYVSPHHCIKSSCMYASEPEKRGFIERNC